MTRPLRNYVAGQPAHIVHRGVDRNAVFFSDHDRSRYLELLGVASARYGVKIHAYVLMTNHVHVLATPEDAPSISNAMRYVGGTYVPRLNETRGRTGHLWEGRHYSAPITSDEYFLACCRYIELNPVRARLVRHPGAFRWSSFRANGFGAPDPLLSSHPTLESLGPDPTARRRHYEELFRTVMDDPVSMTLEAASVRAKLRRDRVAPQGCAPRDCSEHAGDEATARDVPRGT